MSTVTKAISSVEFHVNARQANAALQSIQEEAKRCRLQVEELQEQAAKGVTTVKVDGMDVDIQKRIKEVKALQKTWESAAQSQIKGAKAFDELWKNARMGTIESMNGAQIKAGINASKPIYDRLRLGDAEDRMKAQAIKDMQDQGQKVLNQLKTTTDQIIKQIADGETIAADVLEREARNLKSIMDLLPPLSQEWKDYNLQYQAINQQIERQTVLERQLRGEIVTREDAIRVINAANREATQQEIAQEEQRAKAAREAAEAKAAEADQYRTAVEQKQSEIFATNDLIAAKRREIDAHHESAAAAKDAADKAREAAYKDRKQAEQEAREQQDAYNKQKKIRDDAAKDVEKYRKELEKLGEQDEKRAGVQQKLTDAETRLADEDRKLGVEQDKLTDKQAKASEAVNTHKQAIQGVKDVMEENRKTGQRLGEEMGELTKQHKQQTEELAEASEKMTDAEKESNRHIKTEQEARLRIQQLNNQSIEQLTASLRVLEEENRRINDPGNQQWQENERYIGQLTLRLEELKKQSAELRREPVLDMMTQRMQSLGTLSRDALTETKKFWQAMYDGADNDAAKLREIEDNLKRINTEEQKRDRKTLEERAARLQQVDNYSVGELREGIDAAKRLQDQYRLTDDELQQLSVNIVAAETRIAKVGVEAERQAQRQREQVDLMQQQLANGSALTESALKAQVNYWQRLADDPKAAAEAVAQYTANMKQAQSLLNVKERVDIRMKAGRLDNMDGYSVAEIREGIDAAKKMQDTFRLSNDEVQQLSEKIVAAEVRISQFSVESERAAQRQREQIELMEQQLANGSALTESALKAQVNYWQRLADDPKAAAEAVAQYTANMKQAQSLLDVKEHVDIRMKAGRLDNMDGYSVSELREGIDAAKKMQDTFRLSNDEVQQLSEKIVAAEVRISQFSVESERAAQRQREQIELMEQQLANGSALTESALKAQVNYWQRLADDPKAAAEAVAQYTANMKQAQDLLDQSQRADIESKAGRLQNLGAYSVAEIREGIDAAKKMQDTFHLTDAEVKQLSEDIVAAEKHVSQFSVENERAAQKQREQVATMEQQLQGMTAQMAQHNSVSVNALKAQHSYWQKLIDDPKTAAENLQQYQDNLAETERLQRRMVGKQGQEALDWFRGGMDADASANDIKEQAAAMKAWRDTLPKETQADVIAEIDGYLKKAGVSAKGAAEEMMKLVDAMVLADKAGKDGFAATPQDIQLATKALEKQRDTIIATIREKRNLGQATKAEEDQLADLTKKLRSLKFEQDNVNMSQEKMRTLIETPANAVNLDELRAAIKRADGQLRQMQQSLGQNSDEYKRFAEQVRQAKNVMKEMEGQAKASATAWEKAFSRLKTYVVMYMGFNELWQKITGTMGDMLELSDKMGEVMKTTQFSADQVARLSDYLKELDTRTPMVKLMELSSIAGSIGLKTQEQVEGFTDAANQLMVALPEMGSEAARTLMKIADATGDLEKNEGDVRETLERVGSTIIALRANSAAAAGPITDFVSRVGAVGAQAGISIDQIAALGATVDALGGRVEMSATALSRMIPAIRNNSFAVANAIGMAEQDLKKMTAMEQMVAIFKALRDSVKQFDTSTDEGMNAMADKVEQMLGNSASMQEVMKTLNQQGARAGIVFGLLSQNVDKLEEQLTTATNAYEKNTALMEEYNKMNDTAAARWERLKNQLEEFFVTAGNTSWLSETIDLLRKLIVLITAEGPIGSFFRWTLVYLGLIQAKWSQAIGGAILSVYQFAAASLKSATATAADTAAKTANAAAANAQATATGKAAAAQGLLNKTMKANIITAVVTAVVALGFRLWEYFRAANSAQEAQKRLNEAVSQATVEAEREVGHLNNVIKALDNAKMSAEGRKEVIDKFNRDYSKYIDALGIEIKTVQDLKDNYDLLTSAIRRAAFERVRDQFKAQELEPLIKEAVEQGADLQTGANGTLNAIILNDAQKSVTQFTKAVADLTEKNLKDFRSTYRKQLQNLGLDADKATLSQIQAAATPQATNRLVNQAIQQGPQSLNEYLIGKMDRGEIKDAAEAYKDIIKKEFSNGELFNAVFDENLNYVIGQRVVNGRTVGTPLTEPTGAPGGEKSSAFNEKLYEQIEKFVTAYMEVKNRNDQIDAAFRPYVGSEDIASGNGGGGSNGGGGGGGTNPYGQYDRVTDPYSKWSGDDLVARRKEMLVRVRALANGADVQKVLSEDAKFISEAVRKNIKTTEQAIEWYNAERLKIQEALYNKHLTPTGDWLDPKKGAGNWRKQLQTDFDNYLRILDAYYTERKAHIEKAQAEEGLSEAEAQRLTVENETVWRKHRMELQQIYLGKSADIAEEERQRIYNILAEQDEDSADMVEKQIAISINKLHLLAQKSEVEARKIETKLVKDMATDHYKQQNAVSKQMEAIEKIISEERPFDGITKNLRDNLSTTGVLFADFDKKRREAIERGEQPEDDMAERAKQMAKRLSVVLDGVPDAYRMTFDQLKEVMIKEGFGEWAKAIEGDEQLKLAMMAQIRKTYDQVQEAIRKEAALIKKHADNLWNDALTPDGKSMKNQFEAAISQLGLQADQVKRANSLIGAGVASDRVADRLVIQQMKVQLAMERARFALMHKIGEERIRQEQAVEESLRRQGKLEEAKRKHADIENMQKSLGLAISEEQKKVDEQRVAIQNQLEESQNRLYTELRSWADLLTSSLQGVMEASHAGDAEYYNERAKLNLTGKGGPGAGTYVVIDDAGTSDATAHYEYLDERQALERQHEIEVQNAQAEAWRKLMDDLNMKMSEQITDWLNAAAQNASVDANTDATLANTEAIVGLTAAMGGKVDTSLASGLGYEPSGNEPNPAIERIGYEAEQQVTQTSTTESAPSVFLDPNNVGLIWEQQAEAAELSAERQVGAIDKVKVALDEQFHKQTQGSKESSQKMTSSTQSAFAKMTAAANLYGIAYQAMSNDNLSAAQKFSMMAIQAAGQSAITALTVDFSKTAADATMNSASVLGKLWSQLGWGAVPVYAIFTGLLGGLMGLAASKVAKSKSEIAQATGASVGAGRLATGMLTYAEGNVNELTDPASLTPGRQYNVDGADGKTYRARYMGKGAKTHITNGPEFHLVGEAGREAIIDAKTTRLLQMNETGIWRDIQTLYNGGSISGMASRRRRGGVRAYAEGNVGEFEEMADGGGLTAEGTGGMDMEQMLTALDRNSAIQEALLERLNQPIYAQNILYGPDGLPNVIAKLQKEAQRHGEKYL